WAQPAASTAPSPMDVMKRTFTCVLTAVRAESFAKLEQRWREEECHGTRGGAPPLGSHWGSAWNKMDLGTRMDGMNRMEMQVEMQGNRIRQLQISHPS